MNQVYIANNSVIEYLDRFDPKFGCSLQSLYDWIVYPGGISDNGSNHRLIIL